MSNRRKPANLRAAFKARTIRTEVYEIPLASRDEVEEAVRDLKAKRSTADYLAMGDDAEALKKAEADVKAAKKARDAMFFPAEFRGLSEKDFEALVNEHPAPDGAPEGDAGEGFIYALAAACSVNGDGMTADDWRNVIEDPEMPRPERMELVATILNANRRPFSEGIPKD